MTIQKRPILNLFLIINQLFAQNNICENLENDYFLHLIEHLCCLRNNINNYLISLAETGELGEASGEFDGARNEIGVDGQVGVTRHVVHAGDSDRVGTTFHMFTQPLNTVDAYFKVLQSVSQI